jgi:hypothetical protein
MTQPPASRHAPEHHPAVPLRVDFAPRVGVRRALTVVAIGNAAVTAYAGWLAWQEPTTNAIGIAVTLGVLTLVLWGLLAASAPTRVSVERGILEVRTSEATQIFDIGNPRQEIEVVGDPRRRGWKVLILRQGGVALTLDRRMVDPVSFTDVLHVYRPDLDQPRGRHRGDTASGSADRAADPM